MRFILAYPKFLYWLRKVLRADYDGLERNKFKHERGVYPVQYKEYLKGCFTLAVKGSWKHFFWFLFLSPKDCAVKIAKERQNAVCD